MISRRKAGVSRSRHTPEVAVISHDLVVELESVTLDDSLSPADAAHLALTALANAYAHLIDGEGEAMPPRALQL